MTAATRTDADEKTIESLDFDPDCRYVKLPKHTPCGKRADWLVILPCCDRQSFLCDFHLHGTSRLECLVCHSKTYVTDMFRSRLRL